MINLKFLNLMTLALAVGSMSILEMGLTISVFRFRIVNKQVNVLKLYKMMIHVFQNIKIG